MFKIFPLLISVLMVGPLSAQSTERLNSPDGKISFQLKITDKGEMQYSVAYNQKEVINNGVMGVNGWKSGVLVKSVRQTKNNSWWKPVYGERSRVQDHYYGKTFILAKTDHSGQRMQLEVRAYNEGLAFRYGFAGKSKSGKEMTIQKDLTTYTLPAGTRAWFTSHAQGAYTLLPLTKWPSEAERPLTLELKNGVYAALMEAEVVNYCRTKYKLDKNSVNTIACSMFEPVTKKEPFTTPWHVIMVANRPGNLLQNNDLILNLNPPCKIANTSWIKPGKVIRETTLSTDGALKLIDFAVKRHLQYIHFDAGWYAREEDPNADASRVNVDPRRNPVNDLDLLKVIKYGKQNGIGVLLYVNHLALEKQLDTLLPLYEKWGVAGIKFGFVNVGSLKANEWIIQAVKKCAKYHLMVDIHDEYRPTGFSRTYPNLLTQEGVRGNEEMPEASNNAVLPFTRFLCGAADYTICYYHRPSLKPALAKSMNARVLKTTAGQQLALSVIYYSPFQFLYWYDSPKDSKDEPELAFFDKEATVWDDTKVLDGAIGQYAVIARRSDKDWFIGAMTNNDARTLNIDCHFLPEGKKYLATIYYDDPTSPVRTKVSIKKIIVDANTKLEVSLLASGGQAIWMTPVKEK
ncbi:glycoside hydrolase family 97 protein [Arachidicoccus ginsenosidivorans]|uniref:Glycoside hydrolase family 97 protein n=2 Tax=Arachidicoccus ginsenosidivorans TaxID=496057 RepID=A0A5B8VW08_9BACT|nr:glycoside hydrolase family 97 protein [Arachidicoccus ginsenosidivorans]